MAEGCFARWLANNNKIPHTRYTAIIKYHRLGGLEKKFKKAKWLSGEALQIDRKEEKLKAKEKRKDISI